MDKTCPTLPLAVGNFRHLQTEDNRQAKLPGIQGEVNELKPGKAASSLPLSLKAMGLEATGVQVWKLCTPLSLQKLGVIDATDGAWESSSAVIPYPGERGGQRQDQTTNLAC